MVRAMRPLVIAGTTVALGAVLVGASNADGPASPPRYTVSPSQQGFVRLDTATGAITDCRREADAWSCDLVTEPNAALGTRLDAIADMVSALTARLERLEAAKVAVPMVRPSAETSPQTAALSAGDAASGPVPHFPDRLRRKLLILVGALKRGV